MANNADNLNISVAMAVYNGEKYIREQIDSIISQMRKDDELIISYDESTDSTYDIIREYQKRDSRVHVVKDDQCGVVKNFQNAVLHCSNEIILYSDQDDIWMSDKLDRMRKEFINPEVTAVIHDSKLIDSEGNVICESTFKLRGGSCSVVKNFIRLSYIGCSMGFRKEMVPIITPFPTKKRSHDWWTGTMCGLFGKMVMIKEPLILHRMHENNATPKKRPGIGYQISIRWVIISNALIRSWKCKRWIKKI